MPTMRRSNHLAMRKMQGLRPTLQMSKVWFHRTIEKIQLTKVLVSIKIFPSETTTDINVLKDRVRKILEGKASIYKYEEEPVAFGLIALIAHVLVPEEVQGRMDEVEDLLKQTDGVSEVQVLVSRRIA